MRRGKIGRGEAIYLISPSRDVALTTEGTDTLELTVKMVGFSASALALAASVLPHLYVSASTCADRRV